MPCRRTKYILKPIARTRLQGMNGELLRDHAAHGYTGKCLLSDACHVENQPQHRKPSSIGMDLEEPRSALRRDCQRRTFGTPIQAPGRVVQTRIFGGVAPSP